MTFKESLAESIRTLSALSAIRSEIDAAAKLILETLRHDKKLLIFGNGGQRRRSSAFLD